MMQIWRQFPVRTMQLHERGRKTNSRSPGTTVPGLFNKHSVFVEDIEEWKRNKKKHGVAQV